MSRRKAAKQTEPTALSLVKDFNEVQDRSLSAETLRKALRKAPATLDQLAARFDVSRGRVLDAIDELQRGSHNVVQFGDRYSIESTVAPLPESDLHLYESDSDGRYRFGVISDTHLGSKHCRLDVVDALYDWFAQEGITRVYHAGNWIEGEARFNKYDLVPEAHGCQAQ